MNARWQKIVVFLIAMTTGGVVIADTLTFYGQASDPETGQALYQEVHRLTLDDDGQPLSEIVEYVSADRELLGEKTLTYNRLSQPDYVVDFRQRPYTEKVRIISDQIVIDRQQQTQLALPEASFAIDGGFHYFIQQHFDTLVSGSDVDFQFLSAGRATFIPLTIVPVDQSQNRLTLELRLQNFLLSRLVNPIVLTYDIPTLQLVSYEGLTNVPDGDGKLYNAVITYQYPENMISGATTLTSPAKAQ
ncbi:hypothetical protein [Reinekea blandensis]|uniref:Uncharacterized protein n=1 Tax=Reinekea blandensis MED297 TaxID=314283 RepID=A4BJR9_9GAMM|nr:hypothetical protein [Reinekea blandensis]EAR07644.1 hypothetical protein MED297_17582 [Reinekea sp. MED297] [Reinekea blandensis MED297]